MRKGVKPSLQVNTCIGSYTCISTIFTFGREGFNLYSGLGCPGASQPERGIPCSVHIE